MTIKGIESARLKFEHAGRHFDALTATVDAFANGGHFKTGLSWEENHPDYICHVVVKAAEPIPDLIALQASDVLSNLRAALDHAIFTHVVEHCRAEQRPLSEVDERGIQFPIIRERGRVIRNSNRYSPAVFEVLTRHQPNQLDDSVGHPLEQLNRLIRFDKHRVMLVTGNVQLENDIEYEEELQPVGDEIVEGAVIRPGVELQRWKFRATVAQLSKHPHELIHIRRGGFMLLIEIPETETETEPALYLPIMATIESIRNYVRKVIDDLADAGVE